MAKQPKVTFSDKEYAAIVKLADSLGTSISDVIGLGFRLGFVQLNQYCKSLEVDADMRVRDLLIRLGLGEQISDKELEDLANSAAIDLKTLKNIQSCLTRKDDQKQSEAE